VTWLRKIRENFLDTPGQRHQAHKTVRHISERPTGSFFWNNYWLFTVYDAERETGIPASTWDNYKRGVSACPSEVLALLYEKCPDTRCVLYSVICPKGFSIIQFNRDTVPLSSDNASEFLMRIVASLGDVAFNLSDIKKVFSKSDLFYEKFLLKF
jgi:hypothetical protein